MYKNSLLSHKDMAHNHWKYPSAIFHSQYLLEPCDNKNQSQDTSMTVCASVNTTDATNTATNFNAALIDRLLPTKKDAAAACIKAAVKRHANLPCFKTTSPMTVEEVVH